MTLTSDSPASITASRALSLALGQGGGGESALAYSISNGELTLTTDGTYDFGAVGPIFVFMLDAANTSGGVVMPRFGAGSSDIASAQITKLDTNTALPGGVGWKMGADDADFGSTTYPFQMKVDCPSHLKSFEACVTYIPESRALAAAQALIDDYNTNGPRNQNAWGMKQLWNMSQSGEFGGTESIGSNFFMSQLYGWYNTGSYFRTSGGISGNTKQYPSFPASMVAPGNSQSVNYNLWRNDPHHIEFYYDMGGNDPTIDDSYAKYKLFTPTNGLAVESELANINLKNQTEVTTTPCAHFTYPGYVRGWNIGLDYNYFDNFYYKAVGDGARCRVVIADAPNYADAKKISILEVSQQSDWSSSQIKAKLRDGWFNASNLTGNYFIVIGADDQQIASVEIGQ